MQFRDPVAPARVFAGQGIEAEREHVARARSADARWVHTARRVVTELFGEIAERRFGVRYWNGEFEPGEAGSFVLALNHPGALRRMFLPPSELAIGEAFIRGDFDVIGDLERASGLAAVLESRLRSLRRLARVTALLLRLPTADDRGAIRSRFRPGLRFRGRRHARGRDTQAIRYHYDVSNEFYALWLDEQMVYSCGYFTEDDTDLDGAQTAKLEHICRKLRLRAGEHLLDIGCGWGGLIRHAVRYHGVEALGITLSPSQAEYARDRVAREGLCDRCRVALFDYRDLPRDLSFDKVVSVGMFEHVGPAQLPAYFQAAYRLTRPGGLFLNHGIVSRAGARPRSLVERFAHRAWRAGEFMDRYVFPDGELAPLGDATRHAEAAGFETRDVESLREHYARTLHHWVSRLEARAPEAASLVGDATYRLWRLYMAASAQSFSDGRIGIVQMLLARPDACGSCSLPSTRHDIYRSGAAQRRDGIRALDAESMGTIPLDFMVAVITRGFGKGDEMKPFKDKLAKEEIEAVARYLKNELAKPKSP